MRSANPVEVVRAMPLFYFLIIAVFQSFEEYRVLSVWTALMISWHSIILKIITQLTYA